MTEETKKNIDDMSYENMLFNWRNCPSGHPYFQGDIGVYFSKVMAEKRAEISDADHTAASKSVGWDG